MLRTRSAEQPIYPHHLDRVRVAFERLLIRRVVIVLDDFALRPSRRDVPRNEHPPSAGVDDLRLEEQPRSAAVRTIRSEKSVETRNSPTRSRFTTMHDKQ